MADTKFSALAAATLATVGDELAINESGTTKKLTIAQLVTFLRTLGMPRVTRLGTQHSISSATGTEMTDLQHTLETGTFAFDAYLIVRSTSTSVGPMIGVNFTGTAATKTMIAFWADATTAVTAETHIMDDEGNKGFGFISGLASKSYSSTSPLLGTTVGVTGTGTDILMRVTGFLVVTNGGDLEFWHSSETATATTVEVGSSVVVRRTA